MTASGWSAECYCMWTMSTVPVGAACMCVLLRVDSVCVCACVRVTTSAMSTLLCSLQPCMHCYCAGCYSGWMTRSSNCPEVRAHTPVAWAMGNGPTACLYYGMAEPCVTSVLSVLLSLHTHEHTHTLSVSWCGGAHQSQPHGQQPCGVLPEAAPW